MKKYRIIIILFTLLVAINLILTSYTFKNNSNENIETEAIEEPEYLEQLKFNESEISRGGAIGDKDVYYGNLSELVESSDFIFYGKITSWKSYVFSNISGMMDTDYTFYFRDVLYGEANQDEFILTEVGGIVSNENYFSVVDMSLNKKEFIPESVYEEEKNYKWYSFAMNFLYDVLPLDRDYIIFCRAYSYENKLCYSPLGNCQGVFSCDAGGKEFQRMLSRGGNSIC